MKIYIAVDMEGISGIVNSLQTGVREGKSAGYERGRKLLTEDVNAAVEGASAGGAKEITVLDHHASGFNLIAGDLTPGAEYITGNPRPTWMPMLDKTFDAVFLVGYHAMAGTSPAILEHTQSSVNWRNFYINGEKYGEIGQAAAIAGHYSVPVVFQSGDRASCEESKALLGNIETAVVKEALSRTCAKILSPARARELIKEKAEKAVERIPEFKPLKLNFPAEIKIEFQKTDTAEAYVKNGWELTADRTAVKTAQNALEMF